MENSENLQLTGEINSVTLKLCKTQYAFLQNTPLQMQSEGTLNVEFEIPPQKNESTSQRLSLLFRRNQMKRCD